MENKIFLIIDDDEDDRMFFTEALKKLFPSAKCLESNGGVEAISLLNNAAQLPYCIFLDINMPRIDGRECLQQIKVIHKFKDIIVIMYSTSSSDKFIAEFLALGAAGYLNKPSDLNELPARILEAIKSAQTEP